MLFQYLNNIEINLGGNLEINPDGNQNGNHDCPAAMLMTDLRAILSVIILVVLVAILKAILRTILKSKQSKKADGFCSYFQWIIWLLLSNMGLRDASASKNMADMEFDMEHGTLTWKSN